MSGSHCSSLSPSSLSEKDMQRIYREASQLFLTRRLSESWAVMKELITPAGDFVVGNQRGHHSKVAAGGLPVSPAPVALASSKLRIRVWSLYLALLSVALDLEYEAGQAQLGQEDWKAMESQVRSGEIWDFIIRVGYQGKQETLDAVVVSNLTMLLLKHSPSQAITQQHLEMYLSSPNQEDTNNITLSGSPGIAQSGNSGSDAISTARSFHSQTLILELFALHVLPRNGEYVYSEELICSSDAISGDQRESYLSALKMLKEEKEQGLLRGAELQRRENEEMKQQRRAQERISEQTSARQTKLNQIEPAREFSSEYACEAAKTFNGEKPSSKFERQSVSSLTPRRYSHQQLGSQPSNMPTEHGVIFRLLRFPRLFLSFFRSMRRYIKTDPIAFLNALLVIFGFLMAIRQPKFRSRLLSVLDVAFKKVKGTVGMGTRVSYI